MVDDLKYFDGSLRQIDRVPGRAASASTPPRSRSRRSWLVEAAARRQKWIDQAQSLNIYMAGASGKKLDETYKLAWLRGLKTTYYLRTMGATHAEKSTVKRGALNAVSTAARCADDALPAARRRATTAGDRRQVLRDRRSRLRGLPVSRDASIATHRRVRRCDCDATATTRARECQELLGVLHATLR